MDEARLSKAELGRMLNRCQYDVGIEVSVGGRRYPAVTSAVYKDEDGKVKVLILAYGDRG
jgi:hypothetical protein